MNIRQKGLNEEKIFDIGVYIVATIIMILVLYPLVFVVSASFSDPSAVMEGRVWFLPKGFNLDAYIEVFRNEQVWVGYRNTIIYTVLGTTINMILTVLIAYPLSRHDLPGRGFFTFLIAFTMFFNGGLIPTYIIVQKLGMINKIWAMVIPNAITTYNVIVMRTYFQNSIPWEIQEAALIDGCSNWRLLVKIILPLSKPILAVTVLFYAVGHWNAFFNALIYLRDEALYPLQLVLREILLQSQSEQLEGLGTFGLEDRILLAESIKYALIIIANLPVMAAYPFVQRHFVKGVMIGSIKG